MVRSKPKQASEESHRVATSGDIEVSTYLEIAKIGGEQPAPAKEALPAGEREAIIVIDFGSQYSMLIARRIREDQVYCEMVSPDTSWEKIAPLNPKGFILSGGPASVYEPGAPLAPTYIYESHLPVLGICYGMQALTKQLGGRVAPGVKREYGHAVLHLSDVDSPLFAGLSVSSPVWMSHGDQLEEMPPGFTALAYTENSPFAVIGNGDGIFGLQFHPEVAHTPEGKTILRSFAYRVCACKGHWTIGSFISASVATIKTRLGKWKVINALSGVVDSALDAVVTHRANRQPRPHSCGVLGLLRREEVERTFNVFRLNLGMDIIYVDASDRFLDGLKGVTDPETKRKVIGEEFIRVFEEEAKRIGKVDFLAQGTLYPDVIDSASSSTSAPAKL